MLKTELILPANDLLDSGTRRRLDRPLREEHGWLAAIGAVAWKRAETWTVRDRLSSSNLDTICFIKKIIDFFPILSSPAV